MTPADGCPSETHLRDFAAERLDAATAEPIRAHLTQCHVCRARLEALRGVAAGPDTESAPENTASGRRNGSAPEGRDSRDSSTLDVKFLLPSPNPDALGRIADCDVLGVIGRGGMGIVFQAHDSALQRVVAIKVLSPHLAGSAEANRRFLREARAAAGINHPNVVVIHAVGEQSGMPYLVMEAIGGRSLHERIQTGSPFGLSEVLSIGVQIADGLAAAHRQGVIHRDIKPRNIMLEDGSGRVKITDFGLALVAVDGVQLTSNNRAVGTPAYMSPEQVLGVRVDRRTDLFSLGCVLHAMVMGRSPFQGSHAVEIARKIADSTIRPLHEQDARVPASFSAIVGRLLEKDPARRYQSAEEVREELTRLLARENRGELTLVHPLSRSQVDRKRLLRRLGLAAVVSVLMALAAWAAVHYGHHFWAEPRKIESLAAAPNVLRVARSGGDYRTLGEALAHAVPGTILRVLDDAVYRESLDVGGIDHRGLILEATGRATLEVPAGRQTAVLLKNARDVTIRGFQIQMADNQHGLTVTGSSAGVVIEEVAFLQPAHSEWAALHISDAIDGPITVKRCTFQSGKLGVVVEGTPGQPVRGLRVENNRFVRGGTHLFLNRAADNVLIRGNVFVRGIGVGVNLAAGGGSTGVRIVNNTFLYTPRWLTLEGGELPPDSLVCNNLVLGAEQIHLGDHTAGQVLQAWRFRNNWWEPVPATSAALAARFARVEARIELLSREPSSSDFLHPPPHSPLGQGGIGGDWPTYVGAFPPVDPP
jgi:serine/threonine-protein kinase